MPREKKKGTSGNAKAFISRGKALKKLQLSLAEFRRLCILKGVYPRNPRKKLDGNDKTYYLRKDIDFLAHERLIATIRHENAHKKKVIKARANKRLDILKRLSMSAPHARLDHLVVERYPHFEDALRDLDDPLCIIALFANLPAERQIGVSPHRISNCQRLLREFCHFVAETRSLRKIFVSVKGYYFQARIGNANVTWITPHRFTQFIPNDVDFSVMTTFLELYECILSFVNFRLYTSRNFSYPPRISRPASAGALELGSLLVQKLSSKASNEAMSDDVGADDAAVPTVEIDVLKEAEQIALDAANEEEEDDEEANEEEESNEDVDVEDDADGVKDEDDDENDEDDGDEDAEDDDNKRKDDSKAKKIGASMGAVEEVKGEETDEMNDDNVNDDDDEEDLSTMGVFAGKSIVLGREVPFLELEFSLCAAGAERVTRENDLPPLDNEDRLAGYTHWVIDRPAITGTRVMSLEYVQPQYVFDSVNAGVMLPPALYAPGAHLPPHLSPFVTAADDGGYKPWFQEVLQRIKKGDPSVVEEAAAVVYKEGEALAKRQEMEAAMADDEEEEEEEEDVNMNEEKNKDRQTNGGDEGEEDDEDEDEDNEQGGVDGDVDSEGEEEGEVQAKQREAEKEDKEMAAVMLSRKKMQKYKKAKGEEMKKEAIKQKLVQKRRKIEEENAQLNRKSNKKRRKAPA